MLPLPDPFPPASRWFTPNYSNPYDPDAPLPGVPSVPVAPSKNLSYIANAVNTAFSESVPAAIDARISAEVTAASGNIPSNIAIYSAILNVHDKFQKSEAQATSESAGGGEVSSGFKPY